ncbi:replication initiator protein A [Acuticoccus sp. I52.16.1]|uniref:replication initiator protein A n=1 Tax=Acuticoccus sp. I52.16.1 TaxID=2928472 RepID=UPI001FD0F196|nr:replication initiator protein A [Acuticoccus sp. I52.16.1]UOM37074.1 replication initiator protein A [Acuticoccus sp. I52.16.1]
MCEVTIDRSPLLPDRHPQRDLFVCDIVDAVPKGDMSSMEHPVFSLSTKPDMRSRRYERGGNWIEISPSRYGLATVHDRDVLIYCISQCMAALNEDRKVHRSMRFKAYDLLVATNRQTSGRGYELLKDALRRLQGTQIETNLRQGNREYFKVFGLIESAEIVRETRDGRMLDVEITLSDWVWDAIENNNVLELNKQYFLLRKPLERRLYELARKHCGMQSEWKVGLGTLREKCGSGSTDKEFRRLISKIIADDDQHDHMPDYAFVIRGSNVVVHRKRAMEEHAVQSFLVAALRLDPDTYALARGAAPGWDVHHLESEWRSWVADKGIAVKDADRHFLSFCRNRGPYDEQRSSLRS